jgi:hypothetical protein
MAHPILLAAVLAAVVPSVAPALAAPQTQEPKLEFPQASPAASFKQRVGLTDVEIEYSRPGVKGRKIFGGLVPYGEVWRTGANSATKITFSTDVKLEGSAVPAGSYALFTIPGESEWTVILNKVTGQWGAYAYDQKNDLVRVKAKAAALPESVETMTLSVDDVRGGTAKLAMTWEKTRVSVGIDTDLVAVMTPKIQAAMAAEGKKPYFAAAMFYYENGLDLKQAAAWMEKAVEEQPDAPWIAYRQGLVLAKLGDKPGAIKAATRSVELAKKAGGELATEYTRLGETLIASLK